MKVITKTINNYTVDISHGYDFEQLKEQWLSLQADQDLPFFLTWSWISCWIQTYTPKILVVSALYDNKTVAVGLFTCSEDNRHGLIKSRQYRLHQTGDHLLDQIWIEYNDFICDPEHKIAAVNACLSRLIKSDPGWDEIILSMMPKSHALAITKYFKNARLDNRTPAYMTNLNELRRTGKNHIDTLSSNTRYQIRRSTRLYEKNFGPLILNFAQTPDEAINYFHEAGKFHKKRWADSGYFNGQFIKFHENLISINFDKGSIDLVKIKAGTTTIAIMYYHKNQKDIYFYLQGINYESNKHLKPGLVSHTLITDYYASKEMELYNYMGGYSRYKTQLSNETEELATAIIHRTSILLNLENWARGIKNKFQLSK